MQAFADRIIQMKRIPENSKGDILSFEFFGKCPELRMQNRVASGDIKIWEPVCLLAEGLDVFNDSIHIRLCHFPKFGMAA
ncbi:hypothetical protein SDC9_115050 [bioreactor metagenome]|uniref:Uncharacterized protein n=1 Tax=bioreactor metagenome TaxID=1076179 RepID=A0A645BRR9_9ZZZZ